jgi:hypothetical protein
LGLLAGRSFDDRARLRPLWSAEFADEPFDTFIRAGEAVLIDKTLPDRSGVPVFGDALFDDLAIGLAGAGAGIRIGRF